jgi:hypothetical protein
MSFKDLDLESGASNYLKLQKGENRVRIVSAPVASWTSFNRNAGEGEKKVTRFLTAEGASAFNAVSDKDSQAKKRYAMWVLDRATDEILLAEFGSSIMKAVKALAMDSEYGFDNLPPYDIKITKTGDGLDTEYSVLPSPVKELTEDEKKRVEAQKNLIDFLKETAIDADKVAPGFLS